MTSEDVHPPRRSRRFWRTAVLLMCAAVIGFGIALATVVPFSSETARQKVIAVLSARLDAEVELDDLQFRVLPRFRAEGRGLAIRHRGRRDVPPMISVERFTAEGNMMDLFRRHIDRVVVDRLEIQIPPDRNRGSAPQDAAGQRDAQIDGSEDVSRTFVIDELISNDGRLVIIPKDADSPPKVWGIHRLNMTSLGVDRAMPFTATLTNAVPPGNIETSGTFGPWQSEQPGATPLGGTFTFAGADLSVFKGITGILSASGDFTGTLERIDVRGETDTPEFGVTAGGHTFPLHAAYHAIVDGTNGNTLLEQVDAQFRQTALVAKGGVVRTPGKKGRTVTLDIVMNRARLEDILWMAVDAPLPPMSGALELTTKFVLPPGDQDVAQKLQLDGRFGIAGTRFTDSDVQKRINDLSQRTQGKMSEEATRAVSSEFAGVFKLANGRLTIPDVVFDVPGSTVRLAGAYSLREETIDFSGTAYTDAKISQMTTGFKSLLLKPIDWVFRKDGGGSAIPIKINGTRGKPSFGLDRGRVFKRR